MNANNRLEMFLALNAEAFKQGLGAAGTAVRTMAGSSSAAFTETKTKLQENAVAVKGYNQELSKQGGILSFLHGQIVALAGAVGVSLGVLAGMTKLVSVTREFDKLSAGLITATGSAEKSKPAFAAIQDFAARTPYDLAQVTDSFVKLVNFGLNPSERAMTSYGNTSSALGRELNQMIEAVADAATGEFERLKEFGIKSKSEGDKVSFTFRGITTTVGKNAKEIEEYLIKLGETNFGDAMANRMSTLDGALSNIGDEWNKLFLNISQKGVGDAIADGVRIGIRALEELNAMIVSGELEANLKAYADKWSPWAEEVKATIDSVTKYFSGEMDGMGSRGNNTVAFLIDSFRNFPENVRAFIGIMTVEVASGFDRLKADATAFKNSIKAIFTSSTLDEVEAERLRQLENIRQAKEETIAAILDERDTALQSASAQTEAVKRLREEFEKKRQAEKADDSDRLSQFKVKEEEKDPKEVEAEKQAYKKDLAKKREQLTPEQFEERQVYWRDLEEERPLSKDELKEKRAEELKYKKDERERKNKGTPEVQKELTFEERQAKTLEKQEIAKLTGRKIEDVGDDESYDQWNDRHAAALRQQSEDYGRMLSGDPQKSFEESEREKEEKRQPAIQAEKTKKEEQAAAWKEEVEAQNEKNRQFAQEEKEKRTAAAERGEEAIAKANADRLEAAKQGAEEWAQAEAQAAEKAKSAFQKYADRVRSLQDQRADREKSLTEELGEMDTRGTAESRWRRQAKEAKDYEKAAKAAMKAGELDKALSLSDQAKAAYSSLRGGAGNISDKQGDQTAFRGVKSSGLLGIDIVKALEQATAKTALTAMPGGDMFGDLSGRIRSQLAAVAGGQDQAAGKGAAPVAKVHELKFAGGSMRGGEADVEALLNLLAQAGMNAG